jgi:hypothetical protein
MHKKAGGETEIIDEEIEGIEELEEEFEIPFTREDFLSVFQTLEEKNLQLLNHVQEED